MEAGALLPELEVVVEEVDENPETIEDCDFPSVSSILLLLVLLVAAI